MRVDNESLKDRSLERRTAAHKVRVTFSLHNFCQRHLMSRIKVQVNMHKVL